MSYCVVRCWCCTTPCTTLYDASYIPDASGPDALYDAPTRRTMHFRQHSLLPPMHHKSLWCAKGLALGEHSGCGCNGISLSARQKKPRTASSQQPACTHEEQQILTNAEAASVASQFWDRKVHPTKASQHEFLATCIDVDLEKNVKHAQWAQVHQKKGASDNLFHTVPWGASTDLQNPISALLHAQLCSLWPKYNLYNLQIRTVPPALKVVMLRRHAPSFFWVFQSKWCFCVPIFRPNCDMSRPRICRRGKVVHLGVEGTLFGAAPHTPGCWHCNGLARVCGW